MDSRPLLSFRSVIVPLLLAGLVVGCDRQSAPTGQALGNGAATSGEVAGGGEAKAPYRIDRTHKGDAMPDAALKTADGKATSLKALAAGKPLLVNLWATWCAPCITELPQLASLPDKQGVAVLAVSQDMAPAKDVTAFLAKRKLEALPLALDPENGLGFAYATGVLPTTVLYSADGEEVARVIGAPNWEGQEMQALVDEAVE